MNPRDWLKLLRRTDADKRAMETRLPTIKPLPKGRKRGSDGGEIGPRRESR